MLWLTIGKLEISSARRTAFLARELIGHSRDAGRYTALLGSAHLVAPRGLGSVKCFIAAFQKVRAFDHAVVERREPNRHSYMTFGATDMRDWPDHGRRRRGVMQYHAHLTTKLPEE